MKDLRHVGRTLAAWSLVLLGLAAPAAAQFHVQRVKDINTNFQFGLTSYPAYYFDANGIAYFQAYQPAIGRELWRTDGTDAGTFLVKDIFLGPMDGEPTSFALGNGFVFFVARDAVNGIELWRTDGTSQGTTLVKDVWAGGGWSSPTNLVSIGGTAFFSAYHPTYGRELWKSDGTPEGTVLVKDVSPGIAYSSPASLTDIGGTLYFKADDGVHGVELWKSDGTAEGTVLVKDIRAGLSTSSVGPLVALGGFAYFQADNGIIGPELWRTDGTEAGTTLVSDVRPGPTGGAPILLASVNGLLFFSADDGPIGRELWKTDGTALGTRIVRDIRPGSAASSPSGSGVLGNILLFAANDGVTGSELWRTDGTAPGTVRVTDLWPGATGGVSGGFTVIGNQMVFLGETPGTGLEAWRTDGTPAGTYLLRDIGQFSSNGDINFITRVGNEAYFGASDGIHGREPWRTDGTMAGTVMIQDIYSGAASGRPVDLTEMNGTLFFFADDGGGVELWKSDGTEPGTAVVRDFPPGPGPPAPIGELTRVGSTLFFHAFTPAAGSELWKSDGTSAGTVMVTDLCPGPCGLPQKLTDINGILYFTDAAGQGSELYRSDGTAAGTYLVRDILPGPGGSGPDHLTSFDGRVFFSASDGPPPTLWKSDGTMAGTTRVVTTGVIPGSPKYLTVVNGRLYFAAAGPFGVELWTSDGSNLGTRMVHDINMGGSSNPENLVAVGNLLYFTADDGFSGIELWKSDGTAAGTVQVVDLAFGPASSAPQSLTNVLGSLYFSADGVTGRELWTADNAGPGGPVFLVEDIAPGPESSGPRDLIHVNGTLFFTANGPEGAEMWRSDGRQGGTRLVHDVEDGPSSSSPSQYTPVFSPAGTAVYFTAYTSDDGNELRIMRNLRPSADAGSDVMITAGETVTLNASASADADGDELSFEWRGPTGPPIAYSPFVPVAPSQTTTYFVTVRDGFGGVAADSVTVNVLTAAPVLHVTVGGFDGGLGTVIVDPPGAICDNMGGTQLCHYEYTEGTPVMLVPSPVGDSVFWGWVGDCTGTDPCPLVMDGERSVMAIFRGPQALTVTLESLDGGSGMVVSDPPGAVCANAPGSPATCTNLYAPGTVVQLTAYPSADSAFIGWTSGACSGSAPTCLVTMDQAKSTVALFRGPQVLAVTLQSHESGSGSVFIDPPNTHCSNMPGSPQTCANVYPIGTVVLLVATPSFDSVFVGWAGACSGPTPMCQVTVDEGKFAVALFRGPQLLAVTLESFEGGSGVVNISPPNIQCANTPGSPQTCAHQYRIGTTVLLDASPSADSVFIGWTSGACSGPTPTCQVTVDEAKFTVALFRGPQVLAVTLESHEGGSGVVNISPPNIQCANTPGSPQTCAHQYRIGTSVLLDASPSADSVFIGWTSGACSGPTPTCQVTVDEAKFAVALFRGPQVLAVTLESHEGGSGVVNMSPPNIQCANTPGSPQTCAHQYRIGTTVLLDASPSADSVFIGWTSGACAGPTPTCQVTVDEAKFAVALFRGPQVLAVTLESHEGGSGVVNISPPNIQCANTPGSPQTCAHQYRIGTTVLLDASPSADSVFIGWTSGACSGPTPTCQVTVDEAKFATAAFRLNHPPVAVPGGPYSALRNAAIAFDGTGSSDSDGDPLTYAWDFGDGATGTGANPTHAYTAIGSYTVTLIVHDGRVPSAPATTTVSIVNARPVAVVAGGPQTGVRGEVLTFDGSGSTDGDGDPLTYAWDFGDGGTGSGPSATHAYATLGTFTVTLVVSDGIEFSAPASVTVTIGNRAPVASVGGPYSGTHGVGLAFDGSASTDADGDPLTFAWTFGDGGTGSGPAPSHTYATDGSYTVTVQVSDGVDTATASTTATIANTVPVARPGGPYAGFKNAPFVLDGTASTDGNGDALTYRWDFGDGTTGTGPTPSHTYGMPPGNPAHVYTVTLVVNDGLADSTPVVTTVQVQDHPPVAHPGGPYNTFRNQPITLSGSQSSDEDGDPLTYAWDFGDGTTGTGVAPTHTYTAFGTYVVRLTVNDGYVSSSPALTQVTVPDRPPVANAGGPYSGVRGVAITFNGAASVDPDGNPLTYQWNFGDGTTGTGVSPTHVYTTVGSFVARLVVSDGGPQPSAESTATVTIANRPPVAHPGGPYTGKRTLAVQLNGSASTDPDGDPLTYAWTFGDGATGTGVNPTHLYTTLGTFTVTLKVNDGFTNSPTVSTTVTITNVAPISNAGSDRTVLRRTLVTLDGRASSDPDGTIAVWAWRQLSGPSVTLTGANTSQPRFTAPNVNSTKILDFELKVTDNNGATAIDTVRITVIR